LTPRASLALMLLSCALLAALYAQRPRGVAGPRAPDALAAAARVEGRGFPYEALAEALAVAQDGAPCGGGAPPCYAALRARPAPLDRFLALIAEVGPESAPHRFTRREERLAYYLNAHLAGLLAVLRDRCEGARDPRALMPWGGLYWRVSLRVDSKDVSLSDLAAEVSALSQGDPRVLAGLSKGARGGVPLRRAPWRPAALEGDLAAVEEALLSPPLAAREGDALRLGAPYKTYELRFTPSPLKYIEARRPALAAGVGRWAWAPEEEGLEGRCGGEAPNR